MRRKLASTICNTVTRVMTLTEQEQTKSKASHRTIYIIPETKQYLKDLKATQQANRELFGKEYVDSDHLCVWTDGRLITPDYVTRAFKKILKYNNLPEIRFHDLRHAAGSLLLESGLSIKQIQEYLGHEKVSTTLDIYGHLSAESKKATAGKISGVLTLGYSPKTVDNQNLKVVNG